MTNILAIGLNPAFQRTLVFDEVHVGGVNRAHREIISPGGKAIHFSRAANTMFKGIATPAYFMGGHAGHFVKDALSQLDIESTVVELEAETRTCTTVVDSVNGLSTELVGKSSPIPPDASDKMRDVLLTADHVTALAFCGTYPPGIDEDFFLELLQKHKGKPVMVDAYRGIDNVLRSGLVTSLKINIQEAQALTGKVTVTDIADFCFDTFGVQHVMLTNGPAPAHMLTPSAHYEYAQDCISFVNPIGAGDTCAGVTFACYIMGAPIQDAFSKGLAAAMASCTHYEGGCFSSSELDEMMAKITLQAITRA